MAAAAQESPDRITSSDSINSLSKLTIETEEKTVSAENEKEQPLSIKDEGTVSPDVPQDEASINPPSNATSELGNLDTGGEHNNAFPPTIYAPQAQAIYYGGYNNVSGEWDECFQYPDALELGSPSIYNENPSLVFHTGFGYNPQVPYGPYSPVTTPLPSARGDRPLYPAQQFPFTGPYYQQPIPPNLSFLNSPTTVSQTDIAMPVGLEQQGAFLADTSNSNGMLFGPRPNHPPQTNFGRSSFTGNSGNPGFYDLRQGFDGVGSGVWADWLKPHDGQKSWTPLSSPLASSQPVHMHHGTFGHAGTPFASGPQQRPMYGFGSSINSYDRGYSHPGMYNQGTNVGANLGTNGRGWITIDKGRRRGKGDTSLCSCNGTLDFLSEQSRGPRATRPKNSAAEQNSSIDSKNRGSATAAVDHELYNRPEFAVEHEDAKFFIIKSYSEDNVHKSIKYGVWASTPNGNRKLDAAYREAKEKGGACPVFLFFSVNSSAQFCGVAEMTGPVDFDKSVDYWQQDKWSGQFPVKWHIIKDAPNSLFRHIILENNDNKPVTNSRDTQEVKLEQGLEMLGLFKGQELDTSILDDFEFYEERQKAMQERKALQQQQQAQPNSALVFPPTVNIEQRRPVPISGNFISQMSKSFAHSVCLDEIPKENLTATEKGSPIANTAKPGDTVKSTMAAAAHSS